MFLLIIFLGLFLRGISQSGTSMSAFSVIGTGSSLNITLNIADRVNCSRDTTEEVVDCLRTVPFRDLLVAQDTILVYNLIFTLKYIILYEWRHMGVSVLNCWPIIFSYSIENEKRS